MVTHSGVTPCINRFSNLWTLVTWNSNIRHVVNQGHAEDALLLFRQMKRRGVTPNNSTFPFVAKACATLSHLRNSQIIHAHMRLSGICPDSVTVLLLVDTVLRVRSLTFLDAVHSFGIQIGVHMDVTVANTLIAAYAKCGDLCSAEMVFDEIDTGLTSVVSWNSMIAAYANFEKHVKALNCYKGMLDDGAKRDWVAIYDECASVLYHCQEIDYTEEAANSELFASNLQNMDYVKVPTIIWDYTTPQV
ncbi:Pentatricopeptide repeat-containing protein mitochondrial [Spatholobus suberectus]|nr:Pentatricopeptide repeat-containing protein mitochondrial [Spatholobus suberectus]